MLATNATEQGESKMKTENKKKNTKVIRKALALYIYNLKQAIKDPQTSDQDKEWINEDYQRAITLCLLSGIKKIEIEPLTEKDIRSIILEQELCKPMQHQNRD